MDMEKGILTVFSGLHWHIRYVKISSIRLDIIPAKEKSMFFASFFFFPQAVVHKNDFERDM